MQWWDTTHSLTFIYLLQILRSLFSIPEYQECKDHQLTIYYFLPLQRFKSQITETNVRQYIFCLEHQFTSIQKPGKTQMGSLF